MKKLLFIFSFLLAAGVYLSCQHDDPAQPNVKGDVVFSFSSITAKIDGILKSSNIDDAASIILSIKDENGNLVYNLEQMPLFKINGLFITRPISLLVGNYELTQFIVADAQGNALFVAPIQGSPNAYLVENPLPISFEVSKDVVTKIVPEVVSVENSTPEDFGYTTFSFTVVETFDFLISVFAYNPQVDNYELTTANLSVTSEGVSLYSNELQAITNQVMIRDGYENYILNVTKEGYQTWVDTLTNAELKLHFRSEDNGPLIVTLEGNNSGCTMGTVTDIDGNIYNTVKIGDQWWMAENLKTTTLNDGLTIPLIEDNLDWETSNFSAYCWYNNDINNENNGALYNWYVIETGNICPVGWHVPSDDEWKLLEGNTDSEYFIEDPIWNDLNWRGFDAGEKLMTNEYWQTGANGTNDFCFSALPSGLRVNNGLFQGINTKCMWWTSTEEQSLAYFRALFYTNKTINRNFLEKEWGASIRCIKD